MLKTEQHPFNHNIGLKSIFEDTQKLFVGSFPAFEVVNQQNPRLNFYYGSSDNKFWDIIKEVFDADFEFTSTSIQEFLKRRKFGIIDVIEKCYRKQNRSSNDVDLAIIEQLDFINLLQITKCRDIYTTSNFVTNLLKTQLKPAAISFILTKVEMNGFDYETLSVKFLDSETAYLIRIFTLNSPSANGLRGIQKGLNNRGLNLTASEYRKNQYECLLNL
jgi:G:T/U-mismatch repair DNA glycosylase